MLLSHCEPDQELPDQVEPDQVEPDQVEPDHVLPDQVEPDQVEPFHVPPDHVLPCAEAEANAAVLIALPNTSFSPVRATLLIER